MAAKTPDSSKPIFVHKYSGKLVLVLVLIAVIALVIDTSIIRISDLTLKSTSTWTVVLFSIIAIIPFVTQNLILRFIKQNFDKSVAIQKSLRIKSVFKAAVAVHYFLAAVVAFVILQILMTTHYDVILLVTAVTVSYAFAIIMMGILCHRFFSWFKLDKTNVLFLYGLSSLMVVANLCITLWLVNSLLIARPGEVLPHSILNAPTFDPVHTTLNHTLIITTIASFIVTWCATMAILKNYIKKTRKISYWIVLILPLAYFVSQFLVFYLGILGPLLISNPIFYGVLFTLIFGMSKPIGGGIFGISFWMIARNIQRDNVVKSYLVISGYGFLILFTSNQALILTFTPYPPFGLMTISFVGLASFLVLLGIYSSAISIAQDANLRREIRRLAIKESKLLDSIGTAQMEQEIVKRVVEVAKKRSANFTEMTGAQSSLSENDMKLYMAEVLREMKTSKKHQSLSDQDS